MAVSMEFSYLMQVSLAIGFLFLGGGMWTFSTSNSSIAALLLTLYPRLPTGPNDNRCHLQVKQCADALTFIVCLYIRFCQV